jgi:hypothetical protein
VNFPFLRNVLLKALIIFAFLSITLGVIPVEVLGKYSLYNNLFPGRPRLPFGETPQRSYNLSTYNLEAMFQAHEITSPENMDVTRVIILGDSSVWGTLLRTNETLSGHLNAKKVEICGKPARFFNLGYPTISLAKDVLILDRALREKPDLVIWVTTLEAFPEAKQFASPLAEQNRTRIQSILDMPEINESTKAGIFDNTIFGKRRDFADWARLQFYGIPWAATGIDQDYPENYPPAEVDLEPDETYYDIESGDDIRSELSWDVLRIGTNLIKSSGIPLLVINEPILISAGKNSDIRYNFYYPRWTYDAYRSELVRQAEQGEWELMDAWNIIPASEFTNSAIHLTPEGEEILANAIIPKLESTMCDQD